MSKKMYGLVGKNIDYSFSKTFFTKKFEDKIYQDHEYQNFDIQSITDFKPIINFNPNLKGLNVTIPYKESIIPFLDKLSKTATEIGAVNVIKITKKGKLKGYNSDFYGFKKSLMPLLKPFHKKALILGTGGAAKAVAYALLKLNIPYTFVSRTDSENTINYNKINETNFDNFQIFINCTPLGTSPNTDDFPDIPYHFFTKKHLAFDLIYNPIETIFLKKAKENGAKTMNGLEMLEIQADKSWKIWNK